MAKLRMYFTTIVLRIRMWWASTRGVIALRARDLATDAVLVGRRIGRIVERWLMMGVVAYLLESFAPGLKEAMPTVFDLAEGAINVAELGVKAVLMLLISIPDGTLLETWGEYSDAVDQMLANFAEWLRGLKF